MRKALVPFALLAMASVAIGAPNFSMSWNFNGDTPGGTAAGWSSYTPWWGNPNPAGASMKIHNATQYPPLSGMPVFDSNKLGVSLNSGYTGAKHFLAQPSNSFIATTEMFTDIHDSGTGWFAMSGMKLLTNWNGAAEAGELWFEGEANDAKNIRTGAVNLIAAQDGWSGANKRLLVNDGVNGLDNVLVDAANTRLNPANVELKIKYNTPDNPGTIEWYVRTLSHASRRQSFADADGWIRMSWKGSVWHDSTLLALDPATGDYPVLTALELHGQGFTHVYFDDVTLTSIPEPATLLLGIPLLLIGRRRRHA